jgi:hypothetical protein
MDDHDARNHTTIDSLSDSPLRVRTGHRPLSVADRDLLAERIALTRMRVKPRPFRAGKESAETLGDLFGGKAACSAARCTVE